MRLLNPIKLSREAMLFDSPLYLLKAFLGVMISYLLFSHHTIIGRDMISVLFGMMLSLEPVNISGLKSGYAQFEATILGGFIMAIIISIGGVNFITVPLGVVLTLYISILLDWKNISPVAFFTSIYMSQLIQFTSAGEPSMLLTFRLRIMALGSGVLVAVVLNFLFSLLFYKSMVKKRIIYLLEKMLLNLREYRNIADLRDYNKVKVLKTQVSGLFNDIDFVYGHIEDLSKEKRKKDLNQYLRIIEEIRLINHYFFDLILETYNVKGEQMTHDFDWEVYVRIEEIIEQFSAQLKKDDVEGINTIKDEMSPYNRMIECINRMVKNVM